MSRTSQNKPIGFYLSKKYPFLVHASEEGGYVAEIEELPGCLTQGDTLAEVEERIEEARRAWIEVAYEEGLEIPLPRTETDYSGKFIVRVPKTLHRELAESASAEGTSLNQYVLFLLSNRAASHSVRSYIMDLLGQQTTMASSLVLIDWGIGLGPKESGGTTARARVKAEMQEYLGTGKVRA
jgi:antitoxin HicB